MAEPGQRHKSAHISQIIAGSRHGFVLSLFNLSPAPAFYVFQFRAPAVARVAGIVYRHPGIKYTPIIKYDIAAVSSEITTLGINHIPVAKITAAFFQSIYCRRL